MWGEDEENVFFTFILGDCREFLGVSWLFIYVVNKIGKVFS